MWFLNPKQMIEHLNQTQDFINSPFAFPRLPPRANHPLGISKTGKVKDEIIRDNALMLAKLSNFHTVFQKQASGLFDLAPSNFGPNHPMHFSANPADMLQSENEQLKKENLLLKKDLEKSRQK